MIELKNIVTDKKQYYMDISNDSLLHLVFSVTWQLVAGEVTSTMVRRSRIAIPRSSFSFHECKTTSRQLIG